MRGRSAFLFCLIALVVRAVSAYDSQSPRPAQSPSVSDLEQEYLVLDTAAIHALYMDGEFDSAIRQLESASWKGLLKTHADSVFAYKHLGVMYAAQYETREKGKNYMYRLLTIEPSVKILDMYASDMIYMIFRNLQAEFEMRTARPQNPAPVRDGSAHGDTIKAPRAAAESRRRNWPYWTAGALAFAGAGVAMYFLVQDDPPKSNHYRGGL